MRHAEGRVEKKLDRLYSWSAYGADSVAKWSCDESSLMVVNCGMLAMAKDGVAGVKGCGLSPGWFTR